MKERPLRIFAQPQKISRHLHCPICHEVFDDPSRLGCGHTFCYMCIQQWATLSKACPLCKKSLKHRRPEKDLIVASLIDEMQAKCSHQKCQWTGVYSSLKRHQRTCDLREKKTFQSRNFDEIVELNDDEQMKEANQKNKVGKKKLKKDNTEQLPVFASSSEDQQIPLNGIEHQQSNIRENRRNNQTMSSQSISNNNSQSLSNQSSSLTNNSSLQLNLTHICQRNLSDKRISKHLQQQDEHPQQIKQQKIQRALDIDNNDQKDGYLYKPLAQKLKNNIYEKDDLIDLSEILDPDFDSNYFIIQKNKEEEEKHKKQKKSSKQKWGLGYHLQLKKQQKQKQIENVEDSQCDSNPFEEPIIVIKKRSKKQLIVIDSSEESRYERSIESGEMHVSTRKILDHQKTSQKVEVQKEDHFVQKLEKQNQQNTIEGYQFENN